MGSYDLLCSHHLRRSSQPRSLLDVEHRGGRDKCPQNRTDLPECCCSVTQLSWTLCDPRDCSTPGFPVLHCLLEFAQTRVH